MNLSYLGNDTTIYYLTSGKEVTLTTDEVEELVNENVAVKTKISKLEDDVSKYHNLYNKADSKLETNREMLRSLDKIMNDFTLTNNEKLAKIAEELKIE